MPRVPLTRPLAIPAAIALLCLAPPIAPRDAASAAATTAALSEADRAAIEAAIPTHAPATPAHPRRLLIFDLNVGYGGHPSILHANHAFTLMGQRTGAFVTRLSRDPAQFEPANLRQFDAVFLNNTVGNLFETPHLRRALAEFVHGGGGLLGVHGTSVAFTRWPGAHEDWPEFGVMLGARGANHRASDERVSLKNEDPTHPILQPFARRDFELRDEFFRYGNPYSRRNVRVLLSIDVARSEPPPPNSRPIRADNDYAVAWVHRYGRGRVFYSSIAHQPRTFSDPRLLEFFLRATQFALGDLPAPTLPSGRLTPERRARESLGWRLALDPAPGATAQSLFESIDTAERLGMDGIVAHLSQRIRPDLDTQLAPDLPVEIGPQLRMKLDSASVQILALEIPTAPRQATEWKPILALARALGAEIVLASPDANERPAAEALCTEQSLRLASRTQRDAIVAIDAPDSQPLQSTLSRCTRKERTAPLFLLRNADRGRIDEFNQAAIQLAPPQR